MCLLWKITLPLLWALVSATSTGMGLSIHRGGDTRSNSTSLIDSLKPPKDVTRYYLRSPTIAQRRDQIDPPPFPMLSTQDLPLPHHRRRKQRGEEEGVQNRIKREVRRNDRGVFDLLTSFSDVNESVMSAEGRQMNVGPHYQQYQQAINPFNYAPPHQIQPESMVPIAAPSRQNSQHQYPPQQQQQYYSGYSNGYSNDNHHSGSQHGGPFRRFADYCYGIWCKIQDTFRGFFGRV